MSDPRKPDFDSPPGAPGRPRFGYAPRAGQGPSSGELPPEVSIVTPFHDDLEEFFETEACVLGQSLQSFEWIIVNDASTNPRSLEILDQFRGGRRDPRFRVVDQSANAGPGAARNRGVREARAEFIFQLDSDDLIEPTTLEKCLIFLRTHPRSAFVKGYSVAFGAKRHSYEKGFHCRAEFLTRNCATITTMIRREAFLAIGGFDESIRAGMEDWDLWLRFADAGFWGETIPEYFDWYRRRASHADQWQDWDDGQRQAQFAARIAARYAGLRAKGFPRTRETVTRPCQPVRRDVPWRNPLAKSGRRVLMILPWMRMGGADKFNLDLVGQLRARGWGVTIAATTGTQNSWIQRFAALTPDIFVLPALASEHDLLPVLRGLIDSRDPDVVMLSNSEAAYAELPALRGLCPGRAWVDYNHMEEEDWRFGGHPRAGVSASGHLDLSITASEHLRSWMVARGADPARTEVCTINVDADEWKPDPDACARVRERLGLDSAEPVILYAGRLCAQKQPEVFARTMGLLAGAGERFTALVAGDGEDRPLLERRLREVGAAGKVRMLGECSGEQMRELMAASDIFFLPSRWEGIALVLYEAMSAGAVVVGADVGGQKELVTPDCGVLLPKAAPGREAEDEPPAYARALAALLRAPKMRLAMRAAARTRVESHFRLSAMGDRMDALLQRAVELNRTDPRARVDALLAFDFADRSAEARRLARAADRLWQENKRLRQLAAPPTGPVIAEPKPGGALHGSTLPHQRAPRPAASGGRSVAADSPAHEGSAHNGVHAARHGTPGPQAVGVNGVHHTNGAAGAAARRPPALGATSSGAGGHARGASRGEPRRRRLDTQTVKPKEIASVDPDHGARLHLAAIESSRAWRLVQRLKHNPAYGLVARLRWGPGWRTRAKSGTPSQRLRRILNSRSYRLIAWVKRRRLYRLVRPGDRHSRRIVEVKVSPTPPIAVSARSEQVSS
ncbi:MAG: glycosyltransferase [Phycisphaerales bacterium]|nr:glycosyltransferase [Phycisphaerales bacterium]